MQGGNSDEMFNDQSRVSRGDVRGRLDKKIVIITGLGGGQGREIALLFARAGAIVAGCDITDEGIDQTFALATAEGLTIDVANVDATDPQAVTTWIDSVAERYGGVDVLYNNASKPQFALIPDMTMEQWHQTLRYELDIAFVPSQAVWRHMIARGGGSIINVSSVAGTRGVEPVGNAGASAHAAAKAGVLGLTHQLATEGGPHWIRVNVISPGAILSEGLQTLLEGHDANLSRQMKGMSMLSRLGRPIDVGYLALFLASDESLFITGANIAIDGGATARVGLSIHS